MGARNRVGIGLSYRTVRLHKGGGFDFFESIAGLLKSLQMRALAGGVRQIGLSYLPIPLHRLAELTPWNCISGLLKCLQIRAQLMFFSAICFVIYILSVMPYLSWPLCLAVVEYIQKLRIF
jgi:hypothetical protein